MTSSNLDFFCKKINYNFQNPNYLKQALTHCSVASENNQRLEFLGDSILSFVISNALYAKFPKMTEGELSRSRAYLVRGETLAEIARELKLGDHLILGPGELRSGGFRRDSILADALEALFAAIFLDGGLIASEAVILGLYQARLNSLNLTKGGYKDSKTELQEYLQAKKYSLPNYVLLGVEGEEHEQIFHVKCIVEALEEEASGEGPTRRKAEQEAARQWLMQFRK